MLVGADLWTTDQAGLLGDDDPRFALFLELGQNKEIQIYGAMVWQHESARVGLQNDNDFNYYTFGVSYSFKPHKVALDVAYFRDRYSGNSEMGGNVGQTFDTFLISPSYTGTLGPVRALAQFSALVGSAEGNNFTDCDITPGFQRCEYDVFAWAVVAHMEANLLGGVIRPFLGLIWGSGDDDPRDDKLEGFTTLPQGEITLLTGNGHMEYLTTSMTVDGQGIAVPARAPLNGSTNGQLFRHSTGNPFSNTIGNATHPGIVASYSNPGTLLIPAGLHITPLIGHRITLFYLYVALTDVSTLRADPVIAGRDIDDTLYHQIGGAYTWTLNRHFDIRLSGNVFIPADGVKDIAATQTCNGGRPCQGEDLALNGEIRVRSTF
jgi:hypothetical protein